MRLIWWLATVVAVSLVSIILSEKHATNPVHNLTLAASAPVESILYDAVHPLRDIYLGITDHGGLVRENADLRQQVEQLQAQVAAQQSDEARIQELQDALGVKQNRPNDQLLGANVIAEDPSGQKKMVAIDRGSSDGIEEGMVVLSRSGALVGTVATAYKNYAWIRLITDPDSAVNAQVNAGANSTQVLTPNQPAATPNQTTTTPSPSATPSPSTTPVPSATTTSVGTGGASVRGVADGDLLQGIILNLLPPDAAIAKGTLVVTSGLGGNYPPGILIGSIKDIEERPQAAFKTATLEPATQLSSLETVLVLISFKPARLAAP
jgi:rod shape-determining protein MreC